ncbi:hypothetical protein D9M69_480180 [compost metagenome]
MPPVNRQGRTAVVVIILRHSETTVFGGEPILVARTVGQVSVLLHVHPIGGNRLLAGKIRTDVLHVRVICQTSDIERPTHVVIRQSSHTLDDANLSGRGFRIHALVVLYQLGQGRLVLGVWVTPGQVLVPVRGDVADAKDGVLLARVLDRVVPGGDDRKIIDFVTVRIV